MDVERDSLGELKKLKADLELKTTSDVVRMLLDHYHGRVDAPESEENEGEDSGEPAKRRKIDVREALYSLEILSERPGMLEYYTGFDRPAVDLLIRRFSEVGLSRVFSLFCCSARKRAVVVLPACYSDLLDIVHRGRRSS
jgi:hypothetical protein